MVKYSTSKSRLSQFFHNLKGFHTSLKIDKQGRCLCVTFEQKLFTHFFHILIYLVAVVINLILISFWFNDFFAVRNLIVVVALFFLYEILSQTFEESLIMVHSLGYQFSSKCFLGQKNLFISWDQVQSIFINEVIIKHKVIHVLTIMTKEGETEKLIPLFLEMQPRLQHLELVNKFIKNANS